MLTQAFGEDHWFRLLGLASTIGYSLIAMFIYLNKNLQAHPMRLIMYISMVDSALCWNYYAGYNICKWNLPTLYMRTFLLEDSYQAEWRALQTLTATINFSNLTFFFATVLLNLMLSIDLILMIKYPFASKSKRVPLYLLISFTFALMLAIIASYGYGSYTFDENTTDNALEFMICIIGLGYLGFAFTSMGYAFKKLCKPSISREVQTLVTFRHVVSILGFLFANVYLLMSLVLLFSSRIDKASFDTDTTRFFKIMFQSQGIYMPLLRLMEPAVF